MIVLAMLLEGEEFRCAEDIASTLRRLGFKISPQKMTGTLRRLCLEDSPMVAAAADPDYRLKFYRVTHFGHTQLNNHFAHSYRLRAAATSEPER